MADCHECNCIPQTLMAERKRLADAEREHPLVHRHRLADFRLEKHPAHADAKKSQQHADHCPRSSLKSGIELWPASAIVLELLVEHQHQSVSDTPQNISPCG